MMRKNILFLMVFANAFYAFSQDELSSIYNTATPFLLVNTDARSGGMADVGVSSSFDAFSIHHNPSKIVFNKKTRSLGISYTPWLRNVTNDIFVGGLTFSNKIRENHGWGIDFKYFSLGKIELFDESGLAVGEENLSELALSGAYALKLNKNFSMGIGLKYINSNFKINSSNSSLKAINSFAVDVSGFYESEEFKIGTNSALYRIGFNIANIGPKVEYISGVSNFIPTNLKFGGGLDFGFKDKSNLEFNVEFTKLLVPSNPKSQKSWVEGIYSSFGDQDFNTELKEITWATGLEYSYDDTYAFRTGFYHESMIRGNRQFFTAGLGFNIKPIKLDLSYLINTSSENDALENTLRFSLSYDFTRRNP